MERAPKPERKPSEKINQEPLFEWTGSEPTATDLQLSESTPTESWSDENIATGDELAHKEDSIFPDRATEEAYDKLVDSGYFTPYSAYRKLGIEPPTYNTETPAKPPVSTDAEATAPVSSNSPNQETVAIIRETADRAMDQIYINRLESAKTPAEIALIKAQWRASVEQRASARESNYTDVFKR